MKKLLCIILMSTLVLSACGVKESEADTTVADSTMAADQEAAGQESPEAEKASPETEKESSEAEKGSPETEKESSETEKGTRKPEKAGSEAETEKKTKVVGGSNVVKDDKIVDRGGILAQLSPLADNLDLDEIESLSDADKQKLIGGLDVLKQRQNMVVEDISAALADTGVEVDAQSGKITMDESILFGKNKASISEEGKAYLDTFFGLYAKSILGEGNSGYVSEIQVIGNTDTDGTYEYNLDLSQRRAEVVMDYCLTSENNGLSEQEREKMKTLMTAVGQSYDNPVYDADGNIDKKASRRVELKFIMNLD